MAIIQIKMSDVERKFSLSQSEISQSTLRSNFLLPSEAIVSLSYHLSKDGKPDQVWCECRNDGTETSFLLPDDWQNLEFLLESDKIPSRPASPMDVQDSVQSRELELLKRSPAYASWTDKIFPRVLFTLSSDGHYKRCVTPFFKNFALTYRHKAHKNLAKGSKLMIYAEKNDTFGEPFEASVVDFDDDLDIVLLRAPEGKVFTNEELKITVPLEGAHYMMIGFSNYNAPKLPRTSLGSVTTIAFEDCDGELRFYGSSGADEGDSGAGCYDRFGRLIGIQVSVVCGDVHSVQDRSAVKLIGGKNAITPAISILTRFKKHLPPVEKRENIE